jgi:hypothetical protein
MIPASVIRSIVDEMVKSSDLYEERALAIWNMLTDDERVQLVYVMNAKPPVWDGYEVRDPLRLRLIDCGLLTRSSYNGEEGYTRITFVGYAAYRSSNFSASNVTLPGEVKQ